MPQGRRHQRAEAHLGACRGRKKARHGGQPHGVVLMEVFEGATSGAGFPSVKCGQPLQAGDELKAESKRLAAQRNVGAPECPYSGSLLRRRASHAPVGPRADGPAGRRVQGGGPVPPVGSLPHELDAASPGPVGGDMPGAIHSSGPGSPAAAATDSRFR